MADRPGERKMKTQDEHVQREKLKGIGFTRNEADAVVCGALEPRDFAFVGGTYQIRLTVADKKRYREYCAAAGKPAKRPAKIVERWLNSETEFERMRAVWADRGLLATHLRLPFAR
jgi:hypothetical protein